MRFFITGGSGFIGHNVVQRLQDTHHVTSYDSRTNYGCIDKNEVRKLHAERRGLMRCENITSDIRDLPHLTSAMMTSDPDVVIHMAAFPRAKVVNSDPVAGSDVMSAALLSLLMRSHIQKVTRFVYISSSMVYGDFSNGVKEYENCSPQGTYGILKYAGELLVKDFCNSHNIEYVIVRPSAVYGPRDVEDRVVSKFLKNAMRGDDITVRGPDEVLDFTYVDDIASGIALAATTPEAQNSTFNMTRGVGHSLLDAARLTVKVTGSSSNIIVADRDLSFPSRGTLCNEKAIFRLGYNPTVNLEEGLTNYYEWAKNFV
jgi:nucleoside-diphosphate-sugar epimerase